MTPPNDQRAPAPLPFSATAAATPRWLIVALLVLVTVQWITYHRSFLKLPAVDVFPEMLEIHRGEVEGPGAFFLHSMSNKAYRPLDSLLLWFFGRMSTEHPMWGIHFITLLLGSCVAGVGTLWVRELRLSRIGAAVAIGLMCLHPILTLSMASVDGVDSVGSTALLWFAAYLVLRARTRASAVAMGTILFIVGSLLKEYTFALVPISICLAVCLRARTEPFWKDRGGWLDAAALTAAMLVAFALLMIARFMALPPSGANRGLSYIVVNPYIWLANTIVFITGILFIANTVWAFFNDESILVMAFVAGWSLLIFATVIGGLILRSRQHAEDLAPLPLTAEPAVPALPLRRWLVFLLLAQLAATWPAIIMFHVSEMYLPPLIVPFALLAGIAADGYAAGPRPLRYLTGLIAVAVLVSSLITINSKVNDLVETGYMADAQIKSLLSIIPPDAKGWNIAAVYRPVDLQLYRSYATIRCGLDGVISQSDVLDWPRYGSGHTVTCYIAGLPEFDETEHDLSAIWIPDLQNFVVIAAQRKARALAKLIPTTMPE
jgi:hypothetical protein